MTTPGRLAGAAVYCSWSGGKDCAFALYEAVRRGARPGLLLTMMTEGGERSRSHGLHRRVLEAQADAIGVDILFGSATWEDYTDEFGALVAAAVARGHTEGVFGDIDTDAHRRWVESVATTGGSVAHLPLWRRPRPELMRALLRAGFETHVVAVRDGVLPPSLLGQRVDAAMLRRLDRAGVDLAGENGEYHTVVTGGPLFPRPLEIAFGDASLRDGVWFVDAWPAPPAPDHQATADQHPGA